MSLYNYLSVAWPNFIFSWIKRDQLDVICFIISLFNAQHVSDVSTCHYILLMYPSRCKFSSTASSSCICVKNDCHRVKTQLQLNKYYYYYYYYYIHSQELATYLLRYFMVCIALVRCVFVLRCGLPGVVWYTDVGFSLHPYTTPQHNTNTHRTRAWNNSTNKSQAPEDGCINIRNMLSSK